MNNFICNLHTHDGHSIRDGYSTIEELVSRAKELHYEALALTNHGTVSGLIPFYNECNKQGIKPILGCEMYYVHDVNLNESPLYHMLFVAKDLKGYKNLMKLDTVAYRQFYKKPRVTMNDINEYHEGLICSTACLAGIMRQDDPTDDMVQLAGMFGDDFYMELQPHPTEEQKVYNHKIHEWAVKHNHKEIITLDSHYTFKDDAKYHRYWLELSKESNYYETPTYYLMDTDEVNDYMINYHGFDGSIVERCYDSIKEIVDKCNVEIPFGEQHYPNFCADPEAYLRKRLNEGWKEKGMSHWANKKEHIDRCNYELKMFNKVGYTNYICIIDDYIRWCTAKGIRTGAGRGSCCGSDVMYVIGCTKIDPLKYNLLFERFCNPERTSSADVDSDVQTSRRDELIDYIKSKYGEVYQVRTYGYIKEKSAIRKACQSLGYDSAKTNEVCKAPTIDAVTDKTVKDLATHFSGRLINYGTHASAVIVCPDDINNYTSVERQKNSKTGQYEYVVCYEFHECEAMGLLKLDILGLQHLDIIDRVVKATGVDYDAIPNKDEKTAKMLRQGKTDGVFQSESAGFTATLQKMKVSEANDLIATNALYRPGSLDSGTTDEYILRKNGIHPVTYPVPELESALKDTYGLVIYQEQIMAGCRALCGYSLGQADNIRRIIGRKIVDEMTPAIEEMKKAAKAIGTPEEAIDGFVKVVEASANYSFNHSHAAAYGITAWRSAYLKCHYPKAYMTSFLNQKSKDEKFPFYVKAVRDMGITVRPPELGVENCTIVGDSIQLGTNCIKGVGTIDRPVDKNNLRAVMNQYPKNKLESLIKGGALDYFKMKRSVLIGSIQSFKDYFKTIESSHDAINRWKQNTKHKPEYIESKIKYYENKIKEAKVVGHEDKSFNEAEEEMKVLGFTFGDSLRGYDLHLVNNRNVFAGYVQTFKKVKDKRGHRMAFVTLDSGIEFAMFSRQYIELEEGKPYLFGLERGKRGYIMQSVRTLRRVD